MASIVKTTVVAESITNSLVCTYSSVSWYTLVKVTETTERIIMMLIKFSNAEFLTMFDSYKRRVLFVSKIYKDEPLNTFSSFADPCIKMVISLLNFSFFSFTLFFFVA